MPQAARLGDEIRGHVPSHAGHLCSGHDVIGEETIGVSNVRINGRPAIVVGDGGTTNCGCDGKGFTNIQGSSTVRIEGQPAVRVGDSVDIHHQSIGRVTTGSPNVRIGG